MKRKLILGTVLALLAAFLPSQLAGDCNKNCSEFAACTTSPIETGAGACFRTVTIEVDASGEVVRTITCETAAGTCGDFGPPEY